MVTGIYNASAWSEQATHWYQPGNTEDKALRAYDTVGLHSHLEEIKEYEGRVWNPPAMQETQV